MEQEKEIWKPVVGFEGLYEVSNLGRVKSLYREEWVIPKGRNPYIRIKQEKILCTPTFSNGYCIIMLHDGKRGIKQKRSVHRLVAEAFIPNPRNLSEIDHINTVRNDNRVDNLRWVTRSENHHNPITRENHSKASKALAKRIKRTSIRPKAPINKEKQAKTINSRRIVQLSRNYEVIAIFDNINTAAKQFENDDNASHTIHKCCRGDLRSTLGYVWMFERDFNSGNYIKHNLNHKASRSYARIVAQYTLEGEFIKEWESITLAANTLNINGGHITQCCKGKQRHCGGYVWRYAK